MTIECARADTKGGKATECEEINVTVTNDLFEAKVSKVLNVL